MNRGLRHTNPYFNAAICRSKFLILLIVKSAAVGQSSFTSTLRRAAKIQLLEVVLRNDGDQESQELWFNVGRPANSDLFL
jgi:hypothetical protein